MVGFAAMSLACRGRSFGRTCTGRRLSLTFLGGPAFVCMSYTFVSRGDRSCQSSTPQSTEKRKKNEAGGWTGRVGGGCYFRTFPTCRGAFRGDDWLVTSCKWQKAAHCCGSVLAATYSVLATMSLEFQVGPCPSRPDRDWITHPTVSRLVLSRGARGGVGVRFSASLSSALSSRHTARTGDGKPPGGKLSQQCQ